MPRLPAAWLRRQFGDDAAKACRRFVADGMADRRSPLADGLQGR
ncbi:MAG: hypothetical protein O2967_21020 [Proteobacteria bacterium]|nr:hypothetical protein [Pseudomonadota bacterium]